MKVRVDSLYFEPTTRQTIGGVQALIQTKADTNYDVVLDVDNNNSGWLTAVAFNHGAGGGIDIPNE